MAILGALITKKTASAGRQYRRRRRRITLSGSTELRVRQLEPQRQQQSFTLLPTICKLPVRSGGYFDTGTECNISNDMASELLLEMMGCITTDSILVRTSSTLQAIGCACLTIWG